MRLILEGLASESHQQLGPLGLVSGNHRGYATTRQGAL